MGCEECGFYWNHPDEDKPCPVCEAKRMRERVLELEEMIKWHEKGTRSYLQCQRDEPTKVDLELWKLAN